MSSSHSKQPTALTKIPAAMVEIFFFFVLAVFVYSLQVFYSGAPLLSLLFDSQGYLWAAAAIQKACNPTILAQICSYLFLGSAEPGRQAILAAVPGLGDIVKTGPILPALLAFTYSIWNRVPLANYWPIGASTMLVCTALTVVPVWIWSRKLAGPLGARIAAILTIGYSGFAINSGRILSEIPGIVIPAAALLLFVLLLDEKTTDALVPSEVFSREEKNKRKFHASSKRVFLATVAGLGCGLMMLARPTLLPVPLLLFLSAALAGHFTRHKKVLRLSCIVGMVLGIAIVFAPWILSKKVLTGTASVMVERYGPYNLSAGLDLRTDGWDALPSQYISHPDRFKLSMSDVSKQLSKEAMERPAALFQLLLRKPCRLVDAPWNDFQNPFLGMPWLIQRFYHQVILLTGSLGLIMMFCDGWKRKKTFQTGSALILGSFVAYHFISCVFITMSRYFVTAMPELIIAAAYFIVNIRHSRRPFMVLTMLVLAPLLSMSIDYLIAPGHGRLSELKSDFGLVQTAWVLSFLLTTSLACSIILPSLSTFISLRGKVVSLLFALPVCFICLIATCHQLICSEAILKLGAVDRKVLKSQVTLPAGTNCNQWYLVIDANDSSTRTPDRKLQALLDGVQVLFNGRDLHPDWQPLLSYDSSHREEIMYLTAFAYSSDKRAIDFRQWLCCPLPSENIKSPGENIFELSLKNEGDKHPKIFADFTDAGGKRIHTVSLNEFSWSKGFFADLPGEMRLDQFAANLNKSGTDAVQIIGAAAKMKARIYLLGINASNSSGTFVASNPLVIKVPDKHIGPHEAEQLGQWESQKLPEDYRGSASDGDKSAPAKTNTDRIVRIRVRGQIRSNNDRSTGSLALIEKFDNTASPYSEFAPLAPQKIPTNRIWSDFQFEDFVSPDRDLSSLGNGTEIARLQSIRLLFAARPWWECLAYGLFKGKNSIEFRNVEIELTNQPRLDLSKDTAQWFELDSQFEREKTTQ